MHLRPVDGRLRALAWAMFFSASSAWADDAFNAGQKVGRVIGYVLVALLFIWLLFISKWKETEEDAGFLFRFAVLILPLPFAFGTLRQGYRWAARIAALAWLLLVIVVAMRGNTFSTGDNVVTAFRDGFVQGCTRSQRTPKPMCECLADAYLRDHSLAEVKTLLDVFAANKESSEFVSWAQRTVPICQAQLASGVPSAPPPSAQSPASPEPTPAAAATEPAPPDVARTFCKVTSDPPGANIVVDGKDTGQVSPAEVVIYAGRDNRINVRLKGFMAEGTTVMPNLNQNTERHFTMKPAIELKLTTEPRNATVYVDGEKKLEGSGSLMLAPGKHRVELSCPTCADVTRVIDQQEGVVELDVSLPPSAIIAVRTYPDGADLFIDGDRAPSSKRLAIAADEQHYLTATIPGFLPVIQVIKPMPAGERDVLTLALEEGNESTLVECRNRFAAKIKALDKQRAKTAAAATHATVQKRAPVQRQLRLLERELAARKVALESCRTGR